MTGRLPLRASLALPLLLASCAATMDHQAELLLHPSPAVQAPALLGAAPGVVASSPLWGPAALLVGAESDTAGYLVHLFAYPGVLLLAGLPWLIAGPSYEGVGDEPLSPAGAEAAGGSTRRQD